MFQGLKTHFFKQTLSRTLRESRRRRMVYTLKNAKTIALLFDATSEKVRHTLADFAKQLEKTGAKVRILGYIGKKNALATTAFDNFTIRETSWHFLPKAENALEFSRFPADLLISYNPEEQLPLLWIAAASPATMKIGTATAWSNDFDMQLDTPASKGPQYFFDQLSVYLDKLVIPRYDSARAI